tara:strand:- start:3087 stop:3329 length:243 start_codon:yes stop_codon:yes gene_type:complete
MRIKMLVSSVGAGNPEGSVAMNYKMNEEYDMSQPWQVKLANVFVSSNLAIEVKKVEVKEVKKDESLFTKVKKKIKRKGKK